MGRAPIGRQPAIRHHPLRHSAARTEEYLYSQLIPYIGNKRRLLPLIARAVAATGVESGTFVDLFTGTTVVARLAKSMGFAVVANDWEPYSHEIATGTVSLNRPPPFEGLGGPPRVFDCLNRLPGFDGYVTRHLCPADDDSPDPERERMFFTRANGAKIDAIRERIAAWEREGRLAPAERAYILSALLYSVSYVSNTSGVFKGFHHGWGGRTGTALYRILSELKLSPPVLHDNGRPNRALRVDSQTLAGELDRIVGSRPEIVYVDPPYNQHPYGSNYHVLNTVALWDKPPLNPATVIDGRKHDKSAIRKDWRTERRSPYNRAREALPAFRELVAAVDAEWLLVSYSTDGNIPLPDLLAALAERGSLRVVADRYKRYRVSTPRMSSRSHNVEFVALVDLAGPSSGGRVDELAEAIGRLEAPSSEERPEVLLSS